MNGFAVFGYYVGVVLGIVIPAAVLGFCLYAVVHVEMSQLTAFAFGVVGMGIPFLSYMWVDSWVDWLRSLPIVEVEDA
jgi:hypothetical protein